MEAERGKTHPVVLSGVGGEEIGSGQVGPVAARTFISGISRTPAIIAKSWRNIRCILIKYITISWNLIRFCLIFLPALIMLPF